MSCNSSNSTSVPSSNKTYTTFGDQDVNQLRDYLASEKSRRSVRFAPEPIITRRDIARKAGYEIIEPRKQPDHKKGDKRNSSEESAMIGHMPQKPGYKYKLDRQTRDKLKERAPVISGHTLEHYYRYGKPPFLNYGTIRNMRLTRY